MAPDACHELESGLSDARWLHMDDRRAWLRGLSGVEECVADGLRRAIASEDWSTFERYVLAAMYHPSRAQTASLCEILGRRSDEVNNDDIVTTLDRIGDPDSVACLRDILSWEPDWDEARWIPIKAIGAVSAIGTPEAIAVLREAATDPSEPVRQEALRELGEPGAA